MLAAVAAVLQFAAGAAAVEIAWEAASAYHLPASLVAVNQPPSVLHAAAVVVIAAAAAAVAEQLP